MFSLLCGALTLYFSVSKEIKSGDVFCDRWVELSPPDDWKNKTHQEKLDEKLKGFVFSQWQGFADPQWSQSVDFDPWSQKNTKMMKEVQTSELEK